MKNYILTLVIIIAAFVGQTVQADEVSHYEGLVEWIQTYGDGRIRFGLDGVENVCTDSQGKPDASFEMRSDQPGVHNVIAIVTTAFLADKPLRAYLHSDGLHYKIGCKIYKVMILH